jgi:hypothetical protein
LSCRPSMYCLCKKIKNQKALCTGGMEVPLCEHLVETICIRWKSMIILELVGLGGDTINNGVWDLQLVKCWSCEPYFLFTTVDLRCTILKFIFSLAWKLGTYIPYLISVATCSKEKNREERQFQSTSTCMFNVHSILFVFALCYWLLDIIELN